MDSEELENYRRAGEIAKEVKQYAKEIINTETSLFEIAEKIESQIESLGGKPAFPVNLSINEVAAHSTPSFNEKTKASGLLKIDIGVEIEGYIADTAFSLDLTNDKKHQQLIELNTEALKNTLTILNPDSTIQDIGNNIQRKVEQYNEQNNTEISIVKNLSGHSLAQYVTHAGLTIPNYAHTNTTSLRNMAIAIEPFLTTGSGEIYEGKPGEIYSLQNEKPIRDKDARKILEYIKEQYKTKPFCKRWLEKQGFKKLNYVLSMLTKSGILHNYGILVEKTKKPVSQIEDTVIFHSKAEVTTS